MKTKAIQAGLLFAVVFVFGACDNKPKFPNTDSLHSVSTSNDVLKVAVLRDGSISVNGVAATFEQFETSLGNLAESHGSVWYYREAGAEEPHPNATKVIQAVIAHKLPIRLSTKPDYSDAVGPDGRPIQ